VDKDCALLRVLVHQNAAASTLSELARSCGTDVACSYVWNEHDVRNSGSHVVAGEHKQQVAAHAQTIVTEPTTETFELAQQWRGVMATVAVKIERFFADRRVRKAAARAQATRDAAYDARAQQRALEPPLTETELAERLQLHSPALVEELHTLVHRQLQNEEQRESRLDAKAQGLLGTAGLSLTVAFTFGGLLLEHPDYLEPLAKWPARLVIGCYALALLAGLAASVQAVGALFVTSSYRNVDERDLLNKNQLIAADNEYSPETVKLKLDADRAFGNDRARTIYRRYVILHLWQIWQRHFRLHNKKAQIIKRGQRLFVAFLMSLFVIGGAITYSAVHRFDHPSSRTCP
jgi:hypothetical protein